MLTRHRHTRSPRARRALLSLSALGLAAGLAACGTTSPSAGSSTTAPTSGATTILIKNFAFAPSSVTVKPGSTVTVKNVDGVTHTLTSTTGKFTTGDVASNHTVSFKAPTVPGTYPYRCDIHQYMTGTLIVRAG